MVGWTVERILYFLECYEAEPCIWNPNDEGYLNKRKIGEAWDRISSSLNAPLDELKSKRDSLMVSFRRHMKKKLKSGIDTPYEPAWFAYKTMERFLLPIYAQKKQKPSAKEEEVVNDTEVIECVTLVQDDNNNRTPPSRNYSSSRRKSRRRLTPDSAESNITYAVSEPVYSFSHQVSSAIEEQDECDIYANLLARKLRELSDDDRKIFMYDIDGLFIERVYKKRCSSDTTVS